MLGAAAAREAYSGSDIEDLRGPLADEEDEEVEINARTESAFEVEMLRHIVQVTTGKITANGAAERGGAASDRRASSAVAGKSKGKGVLRGRRAKSPPRSEPIPESPRSSGAESPRPRKASSPGEIMRQTRLQLLQQLRDASGQAS